MGSVSFTFAGHGWRLALPLSAIVAIVAIASSLLFAAQVFERSRQEQRLISDTLWAEQAVSYEANRMIDGLRALGRPIRIPAAGHGDELRLRIGSLTQRSPAILSIRLWPSRAGDGGPGHAEDGARWNARMQELVSRASRLRGVATLKVEGSAASEGDMLLAVALGDSDGQVAVADVSLARLLQHTIPWWLAHSTQITLEESDGSVLAHRDGNVRGRGVYTHRIATSLGDRTLYLAADSSQDEPVLIANLLGLSITCLSLLLAWTVYALWRDLGKRARAEAALRAHQALQEAMERSLVTGLLARDLDGRITYANPAFREMVGYSMEQLQSSPPAADGWPRSAPDAAQPDASAPPVAVGGDLMFESRLVRSDGTGIDVLVHEAPLLDGAGTQMGWMASVQDISERKRNAELLRVQGDRIQKMARLMTMGEMASALAHELNQPLAAATSYLTAGLNMLQLDEGRAEAEDYFGKARTQTRRAGEIIKRVRQFVGHSAPTLGAIDAAAVLKELVPLIKLQAIDADASISVDFDQQLPPVLADRVLLEQIILNLTKNAIEAVSSMAPSFKRVEIFGTASPGRGSTAVVLGVRDRGPGLGANSMKILSTAFSTTKPGGLGMGMAVCRKAAELLGTALVYEARPGGGAEFRFELRACPR